MRPQSQSRQSRTSWLLDPHQKPLQPWLQLAITWLQLVAHALVNDARQAAPLFLCCPCQQLACVLVKTGQNGCSFGLHGP